MHLNAGGDIELSVRSEPVSVIGDLNSGPSLRVICQESLANALDHSLDKEFSVFRSYMCRMRRGKAECLGSISRCASDSFSKMS